MLLNKTKCYTFFFWISAFYGRFLTKKTAKINQKLRKLAKSKPFDEIFYNLVCWCFATKENAAKKGFFDFSLFWLFFGHFLAKKQPNLTKNEENCQNPNCLIKFSEIWYVDASQQNKVLQKNYFSILAFVWPFLDKKNSQNWPKMKKIWKL